MHKQIFGTDGIRAKAGEFPLEYHSLHKLGRAIARVFKERYDNKESLLIATDTRISSDWVKSSLLSGLLAEGITCVDAQVAPTPCVLYGVKYLDMYALGIIISASHNPYEDNGIKIVNKEGKIDQSFQESIIQEFKKADEPIKHFGTIHFTHSLMSSYAAHLEVLFSKYFLKGITIVLDCAHGAFSYSAPTILESFGAKVISINNIPNGYNINNQCGALFTAELSKAVKEHAADIGIALDGDGDRLMVVNAQGILKDGDDIVSVLIDHPLYALSDHVVGTIMTNKACEEYVTNKNKLLHRSSVGDAYVAQACKQYGAFIGAESSGHVITYDHIQSGDGLFIALRLLECLKKFNNWEMNNVQKYPQISKKIRVSQRIDLLTPGIAEVINQAQTMVAQGRLVVRYSGTEPVLRTMVEAPEYSKAVEVSEFLLKHLASFFI